MLEHVRLLMMKTEKALATVQPGVMWLAIQETCRVLTLSHPSDNQRAYFDSLFGVSWMLWARIFSHMENSARVERLSDYIACVCKLKFQ